MSGFKWGNTFRWSPPPPGRGRPKRVKPVRIKYIKTPRVALRKFWRKAKSVKGRERLALLQIYAEKRFPMKRSREELRRIFKTSRMCISWLYKKTCFVCGEKPNVRHHIIQLQHGGTNIHSNIVPLCNSCHAEVHPWLELPDKGLGQHLEILAHHGL